MKRLQDKRAIVTGAASGIGRATATLFAREGASVVACDVDAGGLEATVDGIRASGDEAVAVVASAADDADVRGLVTGCVDRYGGLEVFYANAGIAGGLKSLFDLEVEDWTDVLRVNLVGVFLGIKYAAMHMRDHGGGSIVCTASVAGLAAGAGPIPYSASKAGVINLARTAATFLTGTGIRVNAICPGLIESGMTQPMFDSARSAGKEGRIGQLNPLQRAGQPEEIARAALFLASDESSYVNGQAYPVDGGLTSSMPFVPLRG